MSLLDDMLDKATEQAQDEAAAKLAADRDKAMQLKGKEVREELARKLDEQQPVETERRRYGADPDVRVAGLYIGDVIALKDSGEALDGEWVVVKVDNPPRNTGEPRVIYAARDETAAPPFMKVLEADMEAELADDRIEIVHIKPRLR